MNGASGASVRNLGENCVCRVSSPFCLYRPKIELQVLRRLLLGHHGRPLDVRVIHHLLHPSPSFLARARLQRLREVVGHRVRGGVELDHIALLQELDHTHPLVVHKENVCAARRRLPVPVDRMQLADRIDLVARTDRDALEVRTLLVQELGMGFPAVGRENGFHRIAAWVVLDHRDRVGLEMHHMLELPLHSGEERRLVRRNLGWTCCSDEVGVY